jgi:hypothetical protein
MIATTFRKRLTKSYSALRKVMSVAIIATFRLKLLDGKFPDYAKVLDTIGPVLARNASEALEATGFDTRYIKGASEVAAKLGARAINCFVGGPSEPGVFTFDGAPHSLMIIMGMRTEASISDSVAKLVGPQALRLSLAGLRAALTRTTNALTDAREHERESLRNKQEAQQGRIDALLNAMKEGPKQLEHHA